MKICLAILLLIFLLSLIQATFLPFNLMVLVVLLGNVFCSANQGFFLAFLGGLFLDLATGGLLGISSLKLLLISLFLRLYSRRFDPTHPVFLGMMGGLVGFLWEGRPDWKEAFFLGVMGFICGLLLRFLSIPQQGKIKI